MSRYLIVDVFTEIPFAGNQLGVFPDAAGIAAERMQQLACELGFSETAFVLPPAGDGDARLRIFTPRTEIAFAGHPVLGCAFVLGTERPQPRLRLETSAGVIPVELTRKDGRVVSGWMRQPIPQVEVYPRQAELLAALGLRRSELPVEEYGNGLQHVLVELASAEALRALAPSFADLQRLGEVCVSCFAQSARGWKTRMFAPGLGVAEDPATGSAAGPLAVHLARHGRIRFSEKIEISQGEELGRPSVLQARAVGSPRQIERVEVGGGAVIVAEGQFLAA